MKILVKWPTRGCPDGIEQRIARWTSLESGKHKIKYVFTVDNDDKATLDAMVMSKMNFGEKFFVDTVEPQGKIGACNANILNYVFDAVILASDDFYPVIQAWDEIVARSMEWNFPALDGVIHFPDGYTGKEQLPNGRQCIVTIPVIGYQMVKRYGYIYCSEYKSFHCDNELADVSKATNKYKFIDLRVFQHDHRGFVPDATYLQNNAFFSADANTYRKRQSINFGLTPPELSILICGLEVRMPISRLLYAELYKQIFALKNPSAVELLVILDNGREYSVGAKRNALVKQARGKYLCFIDDDDWIADTYVADLLNGCMENKDCVVFGGTYTCDGLHGRRFDFDIKYNRYTDTPTMFERHPNHLCPVRSTLAKSTPFPPQNISEDSFYARRIKPHLRTQSVVAGDGGFKRDLYFYRFVSDKGAAPDGSTGTRTQGVPRRL